jgi:hypothetical protein
MGEHEGVQWPRDHLRAMKHPHRVHIKWHCEVLDPGPPIICWAVIDGRRYELTLLDHFQMPPDRQGDGWLFTIHQTKAGKVYLFWPPLLNLSDHQLQRIKIKARQRARRIRKDLGLDGDPTSTTG